MPVEEIISTTELQTRGEISRIDWPRIKEGLKKNDRPMTKARPDEVILSDDGLDKTDFEKTMESLKEYTGWGNFNIDFATDDQTGSIVIKIIDRDTGETLRQIPPEQILNLRSHLKEIQGLVFDHMA